MNKLPTPSHTPLNGADLDEFLNQAERFAFILRLSAKAQRKIEVDINQRRAQLLDFLQAQQQAGGFTPNTLLQIQRLHRLWLVLQQFEQASAVIHQSGEAVVEAICVTEQESEDTDYSDIIDVIRKETRIWLLLTDSKSRFYFDHAGGLEKLRQAAELIRTLPPDLGAVEALHPQYHGTQCHYSPDDYWQDLQEYAEYLYRNAQLAQDFEREQEQVNIRQHLR